MMGLARPVVRAGIFLSSLILVLYISCVIAVTVEARNERFGGAMAQYFCAVGLNCAICAISRGRGIHRHFTDGLPNNSNGYLGISVGLRISEIKSTA
jgi:hypothetical protein